MKNLIVSLAVFAASMGSFADAQQQPDALDMSKMSQGNLNSAGVSVPADTYAQVHAEVEKDKQVDCDGKGMCVFHILRCSGHKFNVTVQGGYGQQQNTGSGVVINDSYSTTNAPYYSITVGYENSDFKQTVMLNKRFYEFIETYMAYSTTRNFVKNSMDQNQQTIPKTLDMAISAAVVSATNNCGNMQNGKL